MNSRLTPVLFILLFILINVAGVSVTPVVAQGDGTDRVLIRIGKHEIQPATLNVAPGTTVLWQNTGQLPVKVKFVSQGVTTTCKEPRGFGEDVFGIQESSRISGGEVASLCFLEPNDYTYRVEGAEGAFEGTIHVALED